MNSIALLLSENMYPGRGIILGRSKDGKSSVAAYFIMGRSENSQNRIFSAESDGIRTKAYDESKMKDPSLIIYHPVRELENRLVVTNGDQTDTICDYIKMRKGIVEALNTREYEPDAPNYTPRISGVLNLDNGEYMLSILKANGDSPPGALRYFFQYDSPAAGIGHFIHTYSGDGNPLPSFSGEPKKIEIWGNIDEFTALLWDNLNETNKVSLFVRFQNLETKESEMRIVNKNV